MASASAFALAGTRRRDPDLVLAASVADSWHRSILNCIASVSMSSWMFREEESQERIRPSRTYQKSAREREINLAAARVAPDSLRKNKLQSLLLPRLRPVRESAVRLGLGVG
jgi:hypothetical protein